MLKKIACALALVSAAVIGSAAGASAEPRLALVIGEGAYRTGELPTAANDAGLVAQTLQSAGFEVVQGRDLGANELRQIVRDFLDRAQNAGPDTSAVVYVSGHGVQLEGENYLVPVDARIARDSDVPIEGFRLSDLMRSLATTPVRVRVVMVDAAREHPLAATGQPIAKGLGLVDAPQGFLVAFSETPDRAASDGRGPYGPYAAALVEMMRQPGIALDDLFARVRLRVHESTGGRQTPWHAANLNGASITFFEPADTTAAAPPLHERRIASASPEEAYALAIEQDTIPAYQDFLRTYPDHPLARRVKVVLAARREAIVWRRTASRNSPNAYWTYLKLYPRGPHAPDCHRRLARLSAPLAPPPEFVEVEYVDLPPPLPVIETVEVTERTVTYFEDLPPPPPAPVYLLPPPPVEVVTIVSAPPPPPPAAGILPIPIPIPIPVRAQPPAQFFAPVAPVTPQGPVVIPVANPPVVHVANTTVVNTSQTSPTQPASPGAQSAGPAGARTAQPQAVVPGQPGLLAPIRPLAALPGAVGAPRPLGRPEGAPAPGAATLPERPLPAHPPATPGAHGTLGGSGTPVSHGQGSIGAPLPAASLPSPVQERATDSPKPVAGKPGIQVLPPTPPAGAKPPGAPSAATAAHAPPQLKEPAGAARGATAPQNKTLTSPQPPPLEPTGAPKPPTEAIKPSPGAPVAASPPQPGARPGRGGPRSAQPAPQRPLPAASVGGSPAPVRQAAAPRPAAAPKPAQPPVAVAPRPAPIKVAPRPAPPAVAAAPRPALLPAVPRPAPPPIAAAPRPAPPPVMARPAPPPMALAPRPAPPAVAPRPAPPPVAAAPRPAPAGAVKKCVLPNGQPCKH